MEKISVIIPYYNEEKVIKRAVLSALHQVGVHTEILIVDDYSIKPVPDEVKKLERVTVIRHKSNKGGGAARNTGANNANYDYLALLDADDFMQPNKLELQVSTLKKFSSDCNLCWGVKENGITIGYKGNRNNIFNEILLGDEDIGASSSILVSKMSYFECGGFDPLLTRHQDLDFMLSLLDFGGKVSIIQEVLFNKYHSGSPSFYSVLGGIFLFLKKWLQRASSPNRLLSRKYYRFATSAARHYKFPEMVAFLFLSITYRVLSFKE